MFFSLFILTLKELFFFQSLAILAPRTGDMSEMNRMELNHIESEGLGEPEGQSQQFVDLEPVAFDGSDDLEEGECSQTGGNEGDRDVRDAMEDDEAMEEAGPSQGQPTDTPNDPEEDKPDHSVDHRAGGDPPKHAAGVDQPEHSENGEVIEGAGNVAAVGLETPD